MEKLIG